MNNTSHAAGTVRPRERGGRDRRLRVAVVTAETTWPIRTGGHARVAGLLTALTSHCNLVLFGPKADTPAGIEHVEVQVPFDRAVGNYLALAPRLGRSAFKRNERRRIAGLLADGSFDVVMYTHSYLAAVIPCPAGTPSIVDFANVEIDRQKSIASKRRSVSAVLPWIESWKARTWEPRVARRASANIAVSAADADRIAQWNATTLLIPNATHVPASYVPSPDDGYVIYACNGDYPPNKDAGDWLINTVWPHVISELPHARLVIVGRNTDTAFSYATHRTGVSVVGTVDSLTPWLHDSAVAVAPVAAGGGSQLKILESLAHRRCVVATEYSYRSVPEIFADGVERTNDAAHYARSIVGLLSDVDRRHKRESEIDSHAATLDWKYATRTLMQDVAQVASLRGSGADPREVEKVSTMSTSNRTHIVEPGGRGGVYQHVLGAVQKEKYGEFSRVVIHTARDAETTPDLPRAEYCLCMRWQRSGPRAWRTLLTLAWSLAYLLPHLILVSRQSRIEVQGQFGNGLYALIILGAKAIRTPVVFAPHNSFARDGSRLSHGALKMATETADTLRLYNSRDFLLIPKNRIMRDELSMYIPECSASDTHFWEEKIRQDHRLVIGFVGQLRKDKNPALLAEAVRISGVAATLVYAGEGKGAVQDLSNVELGPNQDMVVVDEYLSLPKLVALVRLVDVIVCPYSISSQSGVAALAKELAKPVIASDVGGLGEQAEMVFDMSFEPEQELAKAIAAFAVRSGDRRGA